MTATIISLARCGSPWMDTDIPVLEPDPFMSVCPTCKDVRDQRGYTRRSLIRLLIRNHPIVAYCVICNQSWLLGANERAELERRLRIPENTTGRLGPYGPRRSMEEQGVPLARWLMNSTSNSAEIPRIHDEVDRGDLAALDREHESRPNLTAHRPYAAGLAPMRIPIIRFRVDFTKTCSVGPGKIALLESIDRTGSLTQAAHELSMSYRRAWLLLSSLNAAFREPVAVTAAGGRGGGGSTLTLSGRELISLYRAFEQDVQAQAVMAFKPIALNARSVARGA